MKSSITIVTIIIILSSKADNVFSQNNSYNKIDDFVKNFPLKPSHLSDIRLFAREIKRQFASESELARAAFYWIAHNIRYDCEGYRSNGGLYEIDEVLKSKKAICAGYADLYKFFCDEFGLECEVIQGFATGIGVTSLHPDSLASNHAWNVVRVNGEWKLIDATWGSGSANEDCTKT